MRNGGAAFAGNMQCLLLQVKGLILDCGTFLRGKRELQLERQGACCHGAFYITLAFGARAS